MNEITDPDHPAQKFKHVGERLYEGFEPNQFLFVLPAPLTELGYIIRPKRLAVPAEEVNA